VYIKIFKHISSALSGVGCGGIGLNNGMWGSDIHMSLNANVWGVVEKV